MKPLILAALLLASCAISTKPAPTPSPVPTAPAEVQEWMVALCSRDSSYVAAHIAGRLSAPVYDIEAYFEQLPSCSAARYVLTDNGHFLYILTEDGVDVAYILYMKDGKAVDLR